MKITEQIKILCVRCKISEAELARRLGTSPQNFNSKMKRESFTINGANLDATLDETTVTNEDGTTTKVYTYDEGGVRVMNTKGNLLPSTGGIGTTLFIVIGGTMVLLFGLLLVTKYRMSKSEI